MLRVGVGALLAAFVSQAPGAYVSEMLVRPVAAYPVYIELAIQPGDASPFDLVVLDARPDTQQRVLGVFTITPSPAHQVLLLHQNNWPLADAYPQFINALNLSLGDQFAGVARRLVVFNRVTGWSAGTTTPPLNQWASNPAVPDCSDVLTFTRNNWPAQPALGEQVLSLGSANAIWRMHDRDEPRSVFLTGSVDSQLWLDGLHQLDPGRLNQFVELPEPATGLMLLLVTIVGLRNTRRQPHQKWRLAKA